MGTAIEPGDLDVAAKFCKLVQTADLFEYLGVSDQASTETVVAALTARRRHMQGMQNNPKFKESANFLIKNFRRLERVAAHASDHLMSMLLAREQERIPMLELALGGVMADGQITAAEVTFLRQACVGLEIRQERFEEVLALRVAEHDVVLEGTGEPTGPIVQGDTLLVSPEADATARLRGARGYGWWDATFTRMLLEAIPGGPGEMVDVYCRTGISAATLLPERPQLTWLGVERQPQRLAEAQVALAAEPPSALARVKLAHGEPWKLPIGDGSVDYVLAVRALANLPDTRPVFNEAWRVLRPGGRVVMAEPDGLSETLYFGGHLQGYNRAFNALLVDVDYRMGGQGHRLVRAGLTIGPTLHSRMEIAGFAPGPVRVHAATNVRPARWDRFRERLRRYPRAVARSVKMGDNELLRAVMRQVELLDSVIPADRVSMAGNVLPIFLVVGLRND